MSEPRRRPSVRRPKASVPDRAAISACHVELTLYEAVDLEIALATALPQWLTQASVSRAGVVMRRHAKTVWREIARVTKGLRRCG